MVEGVLGLVVKDGKFLLGIEAKNVPNKGKWRLLGGKLERGENAVHAFEREVMEEADIRVKVVKSLGHKKGTYVPIKLHIVLSEYLEGEPSPAVREIRQLKYFSLEEIKNIEMDSVSREVFEELESRISIDGSVF